MEWSRKWLVDLNTGKIQQVLFDQSNNTGAIDVKIDGLFFGFKCWKNSTGFVRRV